VGLQLQSRAAVGGETVAGRPRVSDWGWAALVGVLAVVAAVASVLLSRWLFPFFTANNDEPGYVYQAWLLRAGDLTLPAEPYQEFFRPWISGRIGDRLVPVFPPVWPAVLAAAELLTGTMRAAPALVAAAAVVVVFLFAHEVLGDRRRAALAAVLVLVAPFFLVQVATLLAYPFAMVVQLTFALLLLRAARTGRAAEAVAAGVLAGLAAFTRSYDAVLFTLPVGVAVLWSLRRDPQRLLRLAGCGIAGALPVLAAMLAYNVATTGDPLRFALQMAAPGNQFAFGPRSIAVGAPDIAYTVGEAVRTTRLTVAALPGWLFGGLAALPLAVLGFAVLERRAAAWLLLAMTLVFPVGYLFWWGNALATLGVTLFGPQYYLPALAPLAILTAVGLADVWRRRRSAAVLLTVVLLAVTAVRIPERVAPNRAVSDAQVAEVEAVRAAVGDDPALVVIPTEVDGPWIGHPKPQLLNDVGLANPVLYAADGGGRNLVLADRFPDRDLYELAWRVPAGGGPFAPVVTPLEVVAGRALTVRTVITNTTGHRVVGVYATDGQRVDHVIVDEDSRLGETYDLTWVLDGAGLRAADGSGRVVADDLAPAGEGRLSLGVGIGPTDQLASTEVFEQRSWYRTGEGALELAAPGAEWHGMTPLGPWTPEPVDATLALTVTAAP